MNDYRQKMCVLDGEHIAKCVSQDFFSQQLTFEVEPGGQTFVRQGEHGVEVHENYAELDFHDVKHLLPKLGTKSE